MNRKGFTRRSFILKLGALAGAIGSSLTSPLLFAATTGKLTGVRLAGNSDQLRFSLELSAPIKYKVFTLSNPERVVIDLLDTTLVGTLKYGSHDRPPLKGVRYAVRNEKNLRVVLDMTQDVSVQSTLIPSGTAHQLDVAIIPKGGLQAVPSVAPATRSNVATPQARRKFTIAIDPGHGGRDPGAVGRSGTQEKDVVLAVAKKLGAVINRNPDMRAVMTRADDRLVPLRKRIEIAHEHNADLFISIHADAHTNSQVKGSSVYVLSENGASSEAAHLLAESENSYELKFGNTSLADTNSRVASVLLDLSQDATIDQSLSFANGVLKELAKVSNPLRRRVESAGFMVLKSPDIPSMLVETAFISNPSEEKRLRTAQYQQKLADALFRGIKRYQVAHWNPQQRMANDVVTSGVNT